MLSRRKFLGKLGAMNAYAADSSNYKALVRVYLYGGNDCHNILIPIATAQ